MKAMRDTQASSAGSSRGGSSNCMISLSGRHTDGGHARDWSIAEGTSPHWHEWSRGLPEQYGRPPAEIPALIALQSRAVATQGGPRAHRGFADCRQSLRIREDHADSEEKGRGN